MYNKRITLELFGDYEQRSVASRGLLESKTGSALNSPVICLCCGFPTVEDAYGTCYLCDFEDDAAYSRLPNEQGIGANGAFSLVEYRSFFQKFLTHYAPHDRIGLIEYYPETREVRRMLVRLFLRLFTVGREDAGLVIAIAYARDTLENIRFTLRERYPDRSKELVS